MNAAWTAFSTWDTDPATGGGTQPTLSVTGRTDGQGYAVSAGARSITISNPDGAVLVTTVHGPTSGSVTVTDDTTTTPDWSAPADEALTIKVEATKDSLTSEVTFTEQTAYGGATLATEIGEITFLSDMTAGSTGSTGNVTIYEADGTTPKATMEVTTSGSLAGGWAVEWNTSYGVRITGVAKSGGSSGTVIAAITPASSVFSSADWTTDDVVAQLVYGAAVCAGSGAVWYGCAPYGSLALTVNDGRDFKATITTGTAAWTTERWGNYDSATVTALGSTALPSSAVYFQEGRALGNRIKTGATDYIAPADWYGTAWDGYGVGAMLIAVDDDPSTTRYPAAGGYTLILAANNNDAGNPCSTVLQRAKFWKRDL